MTWHKNIIRYYFSKKRKGSVQSHFGVFLLCFLLGSNGLSLGGPDSKESACSAEDGGSILGSGRSLGEGSGKPTPVFLPGESPWTEEPGGPQSTGLQGVRHD